MSEAWNQFTDLINLLGRQLNDVEEKNAPKTIYYKGSIKIPLPCAKVSIIGTRQPSKNGLLTAKKVTSVMVQNNVIVVSGLARGIDTMAHKTAMEYDGKTIAVIGTPLDKTYPKENTELQEKMMKSQMVISQFPVGRPTRKSDFVIRNRTMALISDASIIVEAGEGSGTHHQGWETLRLGRPLFICKSARPRQEWQKKMIEYGAIELDEPADILENLPSDVKMPELFQ